MLRLRLSLCALLTLAAVARAGLGPDDLLLVYNADLPESRELAVHYAKLRNVPDGRMCGLKVATRAEAISATDFESQIRTPIRQFLNENALRDRVRCLVMFYGVPIRVEAIPGTEADKQRIEQLTREFITLLDELERKVDGIAAVARPDAPPAPSPRTPTVKDFPRIVQKYQEAKPTAGAKAAAKANTPEGAQQYRELVQTIEQIEGSAAIINQLQVSGEAPEAARAQLEALRENVRQADERIEELMLQPPGDLSRAEARRLVRQYHGLLGLLQLIDNDVQRLRWEETAAAVDSELMLLWWEGYPRYRWMQNVLCWRNATNETVRRYLQSVSRQPVLITARIDADRPETARRLMDDAVAAEAKGLSGKIYLDAQGLPLDRSKGLYDANLRELAAMIQSYTQLDVTLNNRKALFGPGECPNTMLYCGWYSLRKYINSFTFVPGAVGYHIASFEAMSLKRRGEQGWVVNMLKEGAASSIGPVAEPYLHSFPLPKDFFGLLLTGEFTLGEVYAYTCPLTSWMQMLIGDPLYRPFGRKKHLTIEQVFEPELIPEAFRPATTTTAPE